MDEADALSDRIAVMVKGRIYTIGTSHYIKKKFGEGYHLTITPNTESSDGGGMESFSKYKSELG